MEKRFRFWVLIMLIVLSLAGLCLAEENSGSMVYGQGSESTITDSSDGTMLISINNIYPNLHISKDDMNELVPIQIISKFTHPLTALIAFSEKNNESRSFVEIRNVSFVDNNKTLKLQVNPLHFYDGKILSSIAKTPVDLESIKGKPVEKTKIYLELFEKQTNNSEYIQGGENWPPCGSNCVSICNAYYGCPPNCGSYEYGDCIDYCGYCG